MYRSTVGNCRALVVASLALAACDSGAMPTGPAVNVDSGEVVVLDAAPVDSRAAVDASVAAPGVEAGAGGIVANLGRDILSTDLTLDVTTLHGLARIRVAASHTATSASFETEGLTIASVTDGQHAPLPYQVMNGRVDIAVTPSLASPEIDIDYTFTRRDNEGLSLNGTYTLLWPYYCGNLFPCHSDPSDGTTFKLALTGVPAGSVAVFPSVIAAPAPSYQLAAAIAPGYTKTSLGTTAAGTHVVVWSTPVDMAHAMKGTAHLTAAFDHYEKTYGPYTFGNEVGTVGIKWGPGLFGGMEHHPLWHVSSDALSDEETNIHEAAHGWFGDGVRIACWEDFWLSEGTVNYAVAKALGKVISLARESATFAGYETELTAAMMDPGPHVARPAGCGVVDPLKNFTNIPYDKGALFYRALANRIGPDTVDGVLHDLYAAHVGKTAGTQDLLDLIRARTGYDASACADAWLNQEAVPTGALYTKCP